MPRDHVRVIKHVKNSVGTLVDPKTPSDNKALDSWNRVDNRQPFGVKSPCAIPATTII